MTPQKIRLSDDVLRAIDADELGTDGVLDLLQDHEARFLRLQFSDLRGILRHVDVPARQFQRALDGEVAFDGSSAEGLASPDEWNLLLRPDPSTFCLLPWSDRERPVARMVCDVHRPDGAPFEGDPRGVLRRAAASLEGAGLHPRIGSEVEFYLLDPGSHGGSPAEDGAVLPDIVEALDGMGIAVASAHPEAALGQYEVELDPTRALRAADHLATLRLVAHAVARRRGLRATFMPKPIYGQLGSGLHVHHVLLRGGGNAFSDPDSMDGLSDTLRGYVGGILRNARGFAAITNPLVNSYKRLVPGFAAPLYSAWSLHDSASLVRIPPARGEQTGCEVRLADPAANPYLALAVQLAAGLDGVLMEADPGAPVHRSQGVMSGRELQRRRIARMPQHLGDALLALEENRVVRNALGEYVYSQFVEAKRAEWEEYVAQVHAWEQERYREV